MKFWYLLIFFSQSQFLAAQFKTMIFYDVQTATYEEIDFGPFDTLVESSFTSSHPGNNIISELPIGLTNNELQSNSQFTSKILASKVFDTNTFPIAPTVRIFSISDDSLYYNCTGTIISEKHVLTSGHCLLKTFPNQIDSIHDDSLLVCPIYDKGEIHDIYGCSMVARSYFFKNWNIRGSDFAVLEMESPLGRLTGWLGIGFSKNQEDIIDHLFYKFSYPNFAIFGNNESYNGDSLYFSFGKADIMNDYYIGFKSAIGDPGESGSSIFKMANANGAVIYGTTTSAAGFMHSRFTNEEFFSIKELIKNYTLSETNSIPDPKFKIFPNPFQNQINIHFEKSQNIERIDVYNLYGRLVFTKKISSPSAAANQISVNMSDHPPGSYVINVISINELYSAIVIKVN